MEQARAFADRWGGLAIFLTRWLVGPLGPWVNLSSGIASYSWPRFVVWDVLGEALWVALYVMLGNVFSDRVEAIADLATNVSWALVGVLVAALCAWQIVRYVRSAPA
jgi:membrane protein DedA with SNARE-associated domain